MIDINKLTLTKNKKIICSVNELKVATGQRFLISGINGCGKSSLLKILAGLETDYEGNCSVAVPVTERCYLHQDPFLFRGGLIANLEFGLKMNGISPQLRKLQVAEIVAQMKLEEFRKSDLQTLSGGEKQRVALARALVLSPKLLLLDEPFAELDDDNRLLVKALLSERKDMTILVASPKYDLESLWFDDRYIF